MPGLFDRVEHAAWEVVGEKPRNVLKEFPDSVSSLRISTPKLPKALDCTLQFASGASLPKHTRVALLSLVKKNMQDIYNQSSWGCRLISV